jgi:hypothetical protein
MRRLILIGWFFALMTPGPDAGKVVGPFDNEQICNQIRGAASKQGNKPSECWYFGGQAAQSTPPERTI